jgi:hypothetical protein
VCIGEMLLDEGTKMDWSLQAIAHTLATARPGPAQARPSCTSHRARKPSGAVAVARTRVYRGMPWRC